MQPDYRVHCKPKAKAKKFKDTEREFHPQVNPRKNTLMEPHSV